ncbi:MAG: asparagine synthase-related protein [Chloroflexota bacterium]|nr:asparagine synthase-related protein [Chloroflexota bacterium]
MEAIQHETVRILTGLHNMNLQRVDRATMAHSIEGRVPFLDMNFVEYAMSIDPELKLPGKHVLNRSEGKANIEKWLLRQAFSSYLPDEILWRPKAEFAAGCGSEHLVTDFAEAEIADAEFDKEKDLFKDAKISSKEELYYFRISKDFLSTDGEIESLGRWKSGFSSEGANL